MLCAYKFIYYIHHFTKWQHILLYVCSRHLAPAVATQTVLAISMSSVAINSNGHRTLWELNFGPCGEFWFNFRGMHLHGLSSHHMAAYPCVSCVFRFSIYNHSNMLRWAQPTAVKILRKTSFFRAPALHLSEWSQNQWRCCISLSNQATRPSTKSQLEL